MTVRQRVRAFLALLLYVGVGLGGPLADGLIGHSGHPIGQYHVEGTDGSVQCHNEHCLLDLPIAPQSPTRSPPAAPRSVILRRATARPVDPTQHRDRTPRQALGPRAPPRFA